MQSQPTLHLVSGDPSRALVERLGREGWGTIVHAALDDYFAHERRSTASCLLIDLRSSPGAADDARLRRRGLPPVVFLAAEPGEVRRAVELMQWGAADYLEPDEPPERIVSAVRAQLDRDQARRAEEPDVAAVRRGLARLTERERQVLELVVGGRTSKAIALELGLSKKTIDLHRSHVMHKLDADSVVDLVRLVLLEESTR